MDVWTLKSRGGRLLARRKLVAHLETTSRSICRLSVKIPPLLLLLLMRSAN